MSTKPKTGGPAFPEIRIIDGDNYNAPRKCYYPGQTLRDYFAAKAMAAFIAEPLNKGETSTAARWIDQLQMQISGPDIFAHAAYMMADAMLKAREAPKDPEKKEGGAA